MKPCDWIEIIQHLFPGGAWIFPDFQAILHLASSCSAEIPVPDSYHASFVWMIIIHMILLLHCSQSFSKPILHLECFSMFSS